MELNSTQIKERYYLFDNFKAILIILVVFGHMINVVYKFQNIESHVVSELWHFIYIFHMPCFIFISGYFSKKHIENKIIEKIIIPYFVFNTLFYIMHKEITLPVFPDSAMWYLFSLSIWKVLIPYVTKIRHILPVSIVLALLYDFISIDNQDNGLSKVIIFFPFFLFGYFFSESDIVRIRSLKSRKIVSICLLFVVIIFVVLRILGLEYLDEMMYVKTTRITFQYKDLIIYGMRKLSGLFGGIILLFLVSTIPNKKISHLTYLGQCTITIYLFHYLPAVQYLIMKVPIPKYEPFLLLECICLSLIMCYIFSRKIVLKYYHFFFSWISDKILITLKKEK